MSGAIQANMSRAGAFCKQQGNTPRASMPRGGMLETIVYVR